MADTPAGFSSPMGGSLGRRASAAATAALHDLESSSKRYADNMERAARAAERAATASRHGGGSGGTAAGSNSNGGGARFSTHAILGPPRGFPPMEDDASTNAYQVASRRNGGNAKFGGVPAGGTGATAASIPGLGDADSDGAVVGKPNGGGSGFGAAARGAAKAGGLAVLGGLVSRADTFKNADYLANRTALFSQGGYNKQGAANNLLGWAQGAFRNDAERQQFVMPLLTQSGFAAGSSGFGTMAGGARGIAQMDPLNAAKASQSMLGFTSSSFFNNARMMFGVDTMGRGGKPKSFADIAQGLDRGMGGRGKITPDQVSWSYGQNGLGTLNLQRAGASPEMIDAMRTYMAASAKAGHMLSQSEVDRSGMGKKTNKALDNMFGADQNRASGEMGVLTAGLKEYSQAYIKTQQVLTSAMHGLQKTIEGMPSAIRYAIYGTGGAGASLTKGGGTAANSMITGAGAYLGARGMSRFGPGVATRLRASGQNFGWLARTRGLGAATLGSRLALGGAGAVGGLAGELIDDDRGGVRDYAGSMLKWGSTGAATGAMIGGPWGAAIGGAIGLGIGAFRAHGNSGKPHGDGPGFSGSSFPGVAGGGFRGQEWGDGPGDSSTQAAAAKQRGGETINVLEELLKGFGGGARVTSTKRSGKSGVTVSGNVSYHATGNAIDIAANTPGNDSPQLLAINKYFAQFAPGLNELIYAGPGGTLIKDGRQVGPGFYGKAVMDIHHNHVHVAATASMLKKLGNKMKKKGGGLLSRIGSGVRSVGNAIGHAVSSVLGRGKSTTRGGQGADPGIASLRASGGSFNQLSQGALIEMLLSGGGALFDSAGRGQSSTSVDHAEANAGGAAASAASNANATVSGMPEGTAMANAMTIIKVAKEMGLSKRGAIIGIATAEQESNLINLHSGDRDSQGLFQQRPSQGWGSVAEVTNPEHAARSFFTALKGLDYNHMPLTRAAQMVQRSAYPNAYAKWESTATGIVDKSKLYGDGPGQAMTTTADVPDVHHPVSHSGGGRGSVSISSRGGISIAKVEINLHNVDKVSTQEARRIGKMVVDQIAEQTRMREMSR